MDHQELQVAHNHRGQAQTILQLPATTLIGITATTTNQVQTATWEDRII